MSTIGRLNDKRVCHTPSLCQIKLQVNKSERERSMDRRCDGQLLNNSIQDSFDLR